MSATPTGAVRRALSWWASFLRHHRPASIGFVLVAIVVLTALVGPLLVSYGPHESTSRFLAPSSVHLFGTDSQGYDIFTRMVYGARTTLAIALAALAGTDVDLALHDGLPHAARPPMHRWRNRQGPYRTRRCV